MKLPRELEEIIEREFENRSLKQVGRSAEKLRESYRFSGNNIGANAEDIEAYAAYRIPGTYAAITNVLSELQHRHPDWSPKDLLDIGSGPGTSLWSASQVWPSLDMAMLVEHDRAMLNLGHRLAQQSNQPVIANAVWRELDITKDWPTEKADLVVVSYALSEIPEQERLKVLAQCWASTKHSICIIEPAKSSRGAEVVEWAGNYLSSQGAKILAPWPGGHPISLPDNRWMHFAQRVERTRLQGIVKGTFRPYEDEKFAYTIASRYYGVPYAGRVTLQPQIEKGRVKIELCAAEGIKEIIVTKRRHPEAYKITRKLNWGDAVDAQSPLLKAFPL